MTVRVRPGTLTKLLLVNDLREFYLLSVKEIKLNLTKLLLNCC